jgi:lipoprotein-anchoring transpeptidase ErfK/SrfK
MAPRPNKRRRTRSPRSKRSRKLSKNGLYLLLSCCSLLALIIGLYFLQKAKNQSNARANIREKAQKISRENPHAEALGDIPEKKQSTSSQALVKKTAPPSTKPSTIPTSLPTPSPLPTSTPLPTPLPTPTPVPTPTPTPFPSGPTLRAEPIIVPAPTTELEVAAWQVQLERHHFSSGTIDGDLGMRSKRALTQFQRNRSLPVTGELDFESRLALGTPGNPFKTYLVSQEDMNLIQPTPVLWAEKAKASFLGYNDAWEMLSEKFHTTPGFLKTLNPHLLEIQAGTEVTAPNMDQSFPIPKADNIQIILSQTTLLVYSNTGRVLACFPCSIAADKNKRPSGQLVVKVVAPNPNYTFNPEVLTAVAQKEGLTAKMILPPGPNNPVGLAWIGLNLPGYGIHGTPEPMDISRTGSSGCFRLANWNAQKLMKMVSVGTPISVVE